MSPLSPTIRLRRLGYRLAYMLLMLDWFLRRPRTRGVKCLLRDGDRVLLVRHTYGPRRWDVPGGGMHRHEAPALTARREMVEELGLDLEWTPLGSVRALVDHRRDTLHCFTHDLATGPAGEPAATRAGAPAIDPVELASARWFSPDALPVPRAEHVDAILRLSCMNQDADEPDSA